MTHLEGLEQKKNFYSFVMKMIFPRYRDVSEDATEEVNEQQKLKLLTIKNNIKMKQNENNTKKYAVLVNGKQSLDIYDFENLKIAKAAASLFVLDDKYDTVQLFDNEAGKAIYFDPMVDLTEEQRDKINNEIITVDTKFDELTINDTIEDEYDLDLHYDDRIMRGYDWDHEDWDAEREFYGFGDAGGEFWDIAAFKDEMSLEEFLVYAKQLMHEFLREEVCTKFKFHGFDGILVLSI